MELVVRNCNNTMVARFPGCSGVKLKEALEKSEEVSKVEKGFEVKEDLHIVLKLKGFPVYLYLWKGFWIFEEEEIKTVRRDS